MLDLLLLLYPISYSCLPSKSKKCWDMRKARMAELECNKSERNNDNNTATTIITVILLCGLPGSGKSHLAQKLMDWLISDDHNHGQVGQVVDCGGRSQDDGTVVVEEHQQDECMETVCCLSSKQQKDIPPQLIHIEYDALEEFLLSKNDDGTDPDFHSDGTDDDDDQYHCYDYHPEVWNAARQLATTRLQEIIQSITHPTSCTNNDDSDNQPPDSAVPATTNSNTIILMDDNFHLRGMRKQIHRLLLQYNNNKKNNNIGCSIAFGILWMATPLEVCVERNQQRGTNNNNNNKNRMVPHDVIMRMNDRLEPPRAIWEINNAMYITETVSFEEIVDFVLDCPKIVDHLTDDEENDIGQQQEAAAAVDRAKMLQSQSHIVDKLLRLWVGKLARYDKGLAPGANAARKQLMHNMKVGNVIVDLNDGYDGLKDTFLQLVFPDNELMQRKLSELLLE